MIRRAPVAVVVSAALLVSALTLAAPGVWAEEHDAYAVELFHPQSDDQGHYVTPVGRTRITVFGLAAPAEDIESIKVNGRPAELFPTDMHPFGTDPDVRAVEFRATVLLKGQAKLVVTTKSGFGDVSRAEFEADTEAASERIFALAESDPDDVQGRCRVGNALKDQGCEEPAARFFR